MKSLGLKAACSVIFLLICYTDVLALDKRVIVHITPYKQVCFKSNWVYTYQATDQFDTDNHLVGTVKNNTSAIKTQLRYSPFKQLEIGVESIYFLDRRQSKITAEGIKTTSIDSSGLGDTALQLTYSPADSRKQAFGFLLGAELGLPTGDEDEDLGNGAYNLSFRSTISLNTSVGFPYLAAIYTSSGDTKKDGYTTEKPDDLMLALGLNSRRWHGLSLDARLFNDFLYGHAVNHNNSTRVVTGSHDIPGYRLTCKYLFFDVFEGSLFFEQAWPEDHLLTSNGTSLTKRPRGTERFALAIRVLW